MNKKISKGVECLFADLIVSDENCEFDVLIIGSGYGGSISSEMLAGHKNEDGQILRVGVLERGLEYRPGDFPDVEAEIPAHIRYAGPDSKKPSGKMEGLYDLRFSNDLLVAQANGLGGGSLINAGVMEQPSPSIFESGWPHDLCSTDDNNPLDTHYKDVEVSLGAKSDLGDNTIKLHQGCEKILKYKELERLAGKEYQERVSKTRITVSMRDGFETSSNVKLQGCNLCGDCVSGCNYGAKNSLDYSVLHGAYRKGAEIYSGATVLRVKKMDDGCWALDVVYTSEQLRLRDPEIYTLRARNVIVSAGSLGSTELLSHSETNNLKFSPMLGKGFSSNGDIWLVGFNQNSDVNGIADECIAPHERKIGPTITGMIDLRDADQKSAFQEMAVPAMFRRIFGETFKTTNTIYSLGDMDCSDHSMVDNTHDPAALNPDELKRTSLYAAMTEDDADGFLKLNYKQNYDELGVEALSKLVPGTMTVDWPELKYKKLLNQQMENLQNLSNNSVGGRVLSSPTWRPLPESLMSLSANTLGPPVSVHPLGGCRMGDNVSLGVVDSYGRVFDPLSKADGYHKGLFVMDGAIIPKCLGINPALTIAAVTHRAAKKLLHEIQGQGAKKIDVAYKRPPIEITQIKQSKAVERTVTKTEIIERMSGPIKLTLNGKSEDYILEFTLKSDPKRFDVVANSKGGPILLNKDILKYKAPESYSAKGYNHLRIYKADDWHRINLQDRSESAVVNGEQKLKNIEVRLDEIAKYAATVNGSFFVLNRESTTVLGRTFRSIGAWIFNRGTRDLHKLLKPKDYEPLRPKSSLRTKIKWARKFLSIMVKNASHAGEIRSLIYSLEICKVDKNKFSEDGFTLRKIVAQKYFSFTCRSNPWRQLSEARITEFDLKSDDWRYEPMKRNDIQLDTHFLYRNKTPLFRLVEQDNQVTSMMDVVSFLAYLFRQLLLIHFWSFRSPDQANPLYFNPAKRFAHAVKGLPKPVSIPISIFTPDTLINEYDAAEKTDIRLIGFRHSEPTDVNNPPVLLIHGYSASSSSFAHESIPVPLAKKLFDQGKDVWTLDLRTSSAFEYAKLPWKFEDIAQNDIPVAIKYLFRNVYKTSTKIDVVGHCMGATMLSMAILETKNGFSDCLDDSGKPLTPQHYINSVVLSQGSPTVVLSPDNTFRSFIGSYVKDIFPQDYQFRPKENSQNVVDRVLDLILSTLPYEGEDYTKHFPWYKPWRRMTYTRTRHRMDALYGRTFNLSNMDSLTLKHIDELFGPVSIETMTQIMHFAELQTITNRKGHNEYVSHENLNKKWRGIPTLNIQCLNNGVIDVTTQHRTKAIFDSAGIPLHTHLVKDESIGHQDSIIGVHAEKHVFNKMGQFLEDPHNFEPCRTANQVQGTSSLHGSWMPAPPKYGPVLIPHGSNKLKVLAGSDEIRATMAILVLIPVTKGSSKYIVVKDKLSASIATGYISFGAAMRKARTSENENWMITELELSDREDIDGYVSLFLYSGSPNLGFSEEVTDPDEVEEFLKMKQLDKILLGDFVLKLNVKSDPALQSYQVPKFSEARFLEQAEGAYLKAFRSPEVVLGGGMGRGIPEHNVVRGHSKLDALIDGLSKVVTKFFDSASAEVEKLENCLVIPASAKASIHNFVLGSCCYPAGFVDSIPASESYRLLSEYLEQTEYDVSPDLLVLLGDQIYSDATAGLFDPRASYDKHSLPYFKFYGDPYVKQVLRRLPATMMLDDHEIVNNWEPLRPYGEINTQIHCSNISKNQELLEDGVRSFFKYQRGTAVQKSNDGRLKLWYEHSAGGNNFFYVDARVDRSYRIAKKIDEARLVSANQYNDLTAWLEKSPQDEFKFICSGPIFLPRNRTGSDELKSEPGAIRHDGWDGYPSTMIDLLGFIVSKNIQNVIFLSGDEHLDCYAKAVIESQGNSVTIRSIHCSGIYSPMPFANGKEHNLMANDKFSFEYQTKEGETIKPNCTVTSTFDLSDIADAPANTASIWGDEPVQIEKIGGFALIKPKSIRRTQ